MTYLAPNGAGVEFDFVDVGYTPPTDPRTSLSFDFTGGGFTSFAFTDDIAFKPPVLNTTGWPQNVRLRFAPSTIFGLPMAYATLHMKQTANYGVHISGTFTPPKRYVQLHLIAHKPQPNVQATWLGIPPRFGEVRPIVMPKMVSNIHGHYDNRVHRFDALLDYKANDWKVAAPHTPEVHSEWSKPNTSRERKLDLWKEGGDGSHTSKDGYQIADHSLWLAQEMDWLNAAPAAGEEHYPYKRAQPLPLGAGFWWELGIQTSRGYVPQYRSTCIHENIIRLSASKNALPLHELDVQGWKRGLRKIPGKQLPWGLGKNPLPGMEPPTPPKPADPPPTTFLPDIHLHCLPQWTEITTKELVWTKPDYAAPVGPMVLNFGEPGYVAPDFRELAFDFTAQLQLSWVENTTKTNKGNNVTIKFNKYACWEDPNDMPPIVVPVLGVYFVSNDVSMSRVDDGTPIHVHKVSVSIDRNSWAWGLSATLAPTELDKVAPDSSGPVEIKVLINGTEWRFLVEGYSKSETFGVTGIQIKGRSVTAYLDAPYAPINSKIFDSIINAQQIAEQEILRATLVSGFTLDWGLTDTLGTLSTPTLDAGAYGYQSKSPMQVINEVAQGLKGYVQSHPSQRLIQIKGGYPKAPWAWGAATAEVTIPRDFILSQSLNWNQKPDWNGVYVTGDKAGLSAFVKRAGTAGDIAMETFTSPFIADETAARAAGISLLSEAGKQAEVQIQVPMVSQIGLVTPGKLIQVADWKGLVRGVQVDAEWNSDNLSVGQQLAIERHY